MNHTGIRNAFFTLLFLLTACSSSQTDRNGSPYFQTRLTLPATITGVDGNRLEIQVAKPAPLEKETRLAMKLAQGIVDRSYFLEEKKTRLNDEPVAIERVSGNMLLVRTLSDRHPFVNGQQAAVALDKKTIAIKDFQVIRGRDKNIAVYIQENMTTALVNSGQFNVVERFKLESVLNELKLAQTGVMDTGQAKEVGRLIGADLILTGTLAQMGKDWNANLRLINTETGLIIAAINQTGPLNELMETAYRERGGIAGSFDSKDTDLAGWIVGRQFRDRVGKDGYTRIFMDMNQGANHTAGSLAMDFKLGTQRIVLEKTMVADLTNLMKRDLSQYDGIEFYIKGSKDWTVLFWINEKPESEPDEESWFRPVVAGPQWKKVTISFNSMSLNRKKAKRLKTNQIFNLDAVENISWLIMEKQTPPGSEGTIWIDEVAFY